MGLNWPVNCVSEVAVFISVSAVYKTERPNYIGRQAHSNFTQHIYYMVHRIGYHNLEQYVWEPELIKQAHSNFTEHAIQSTCQFRPTLYLPRHCIYTPLLLCSSGILCNFCYILPCTKGLELNFYVVLALLKYSVACTLCTWSSPAVH